MALVCVLGISEIIADRSGPCCSLTSVGFVHMACP